MCHSIASTYVIGIQVHMLEHYKYTCYSVISTAINNVRITSTLITSTALQMHRHSVTNTALVLQYY